MGQGGCRLLLTGQRPSPYDCFMQARQTIQDSGPNSGAKGSPRTGWLRFLAPALLAPALLAITVAMGLPVAGPAAAQDEPPPPHDLRVGTSGLPVPRYVSLGAQEVNMRTGPGTRYPIKWVYTRKSLPMRVEAEFDIWRKVRDHDGEVGWVHGSLLSGRRHVVITGEGPDNIQALYEKPHPASIAMLRAEDGVIAELLQCASGWCRIQIDGKKGWLPHTAIWGVMDSDLGG